MSRQERRAKLKQSIGAISRQGMDLTAPRPDQLWSVIAATRILMDILESKSPTRASDAAKRAHEFFEISLKRNPSEHAIECGRGCAFCCHLRVTAMAPEIFLLANHIRREFKNDFDAVLARIRAADKNARGLSGRDRAKQHFPCGLLVGNVCTVYSARPGPCRGVTSASVRACQAAFNGAAVAIPTPAVWSTLRNAEVQALMAALTAAELPAESYELNEAVCVALDNPDAESRWLKGEDVFAGVSTLRIGIDNPAVTENNRRVIAQLIAGALGKELPQGG
jgi:Fe-S-cluster containining protein